jgi:predicted GH43/DUF377 family glycosyl hydrolase
MRAITVQPEPTESTILEPDPGRLVARTFLPGAGHFGMEPTDPEAERLSLIVERLVDLTPAERAVLLDEARERSSPRFDDIEATWAQSLDHGAALLPWLAGLDDPELRSLVGATLTQGYAYEAAALTNPSVVPYGPARNGSQPFVMSARAIGEGHISSIAFFTGALHDDGTMSFDERHPHVTNGTRRVPRFDRSVFATQLEEMGVWGHVADRVLMSLDPEFGVADLERALAQATEMDFEPIEALEPIRRIHWLASSNYEVAFDDRRPVSEHLLSPAIPIESHGMEDARFVRMVEDDGSSTFYATYTAWNGAHILPQLIETPDFHTFKMSTMTGPAVHHKGMALFPRRLDGDYLALSRHDHERLFLMRSDDIRSWGSAEVLLAPELPWEVVQIGNCGSPIETDSGWLVITHGVGPMRRYVLGAILLDLDEPSKVIGRLTDPLIEPSGRDTVGYVPDVVYSCGSMSHAKWLMVPYGYADHGIRVEVMPLNGLLDRMS